MKRKYGWKPDIPDVRDFAYKLLAPKVSLPKYVDLRPQFPPVVDQGQLGSCTGNSIAGAFHYGMLKQREIAFPPSRLFIYYNERVMENTVDQDAGAMIRDGIKTLNKTGVCSEMLWPYDVSKFTLQPGKEAFAEAEKHKALTYTRLNNSAINELKNCLANGLPFVFGFSVYESFESAKVAKNGKMPMPAKKEKMLGGHAVCCVGYDDTKKVFIVRNSWGTSWGDKGYFYMPYAYITDANLADDFWTINLIS